MSQITPLDKDRALAESNGVRIMTMVGSKGLTVRATIIAGLDDGIVPRLDADLGEERRLLYVAMTRPKEFLFCTWAGQRRGPTARAGPARVRPASSTLPLLCRWASAIPGLADLFAQQVSRTREVSSLAPFWLRTLRKQARHPARGKRRWENKAQRCSWTIRSEYTTVHQR